MMRLSGSLGLATAFGSTLLSGAFGLRPRLRLPRACPFGRPGIQLRLPLRRLRLGVVLEALLARLQPRQAVLAVSEVRGDLVAALGAVPVVLLLVRGLGLVHHRLDLRVDALRRPVGVQRRVRLNHGAVERDQAQPHQARPWHIFSTCRNTSAMRALWRRRKRAITVWSGTRSPTMKR
jgi:hypothetical protein